MGDGRTLEVCRDFERGRCQRADDECRYAHPPSHVEIRSGRVTCCVDSLMERCQRTDPPCRYLHPPRHLKEQLLMGGGGGGRRSDSYGGGRGGRGGGFGDLGGGFGGAGGGDFSGMNPYLADTLNKYKSLLDAALSAAGGGSGGYRGGSDYGSFRGDARAKGAVEVCRQFLRGTCNRAEDECRYAHPPNHIKVGPDNCVTICMDNVNGRCNRESCRYFHAPEHLQRPFLSGGGRSRQPYDRKRSANGSGSGYDGGGENENEAAEDDYGPASKRAAF